MKNKILMIVWISIFFYSFIYAQKENIPIFYINYPDLRPNLIKEIIEDPYAIYVADGEKIELQNGEYNLITGKVETASNLFDTYDKLKKFNKKICAISLPAGYFVEAFQVDDNGDKIDSIFFTTSIPHLGKWHNRISYLKIYGPYVVVMNEEGRQLFLDQGSCNTEILLQGLFKKVKRIDGDNLKYGWRPEFNNKKELISISIINKKPILNEGQIKYKSEPKEKKPILKKNIEEPLVKSRVESNLFMDEGFQKFLNEKIMNCPPAEIIRIVADSIQMENDIYINDREFEIICNYFTSRNFILAQRSDAITKKDIRLIAKDINHTIINVNGNHAGLKFYPGEGEVTRLTTIDTIIESFTKTNNMTGSYSGQDAGNIEIFYTHKSNTVLYTRGGTKSPIPPKFLFGSAKRQDIKVGNFNSLKMLAYQYPTFESIPTNWLNQKSFFVMLPTPWVDKWTNGNDGAIVDSMLSEADINSLVSEYNDGMTLNDIKSIPYEIQNIPAKARYKFPAFFTEENFEGKDTLFKDRKEKYIFDKVKEFQSLKVPKGFHVLITGKDNSGKLNDIEYYFFNDFPKLPINKISSIEIKYEGKTSTSIRSGYEWTLGKFVLSNDKYIWRGGSYQKK